MEVLKLRDISATSLSGTAFMSGTKSKYLPAAHLYQSSQDNLMFHSMRRWRYERTRTPPWTWH